VHTLIGFISDAHGNSQAFDRGVSLLLAQGAERLYFLGDAIGYVPTAAVLDSLVHLGDWVQCIRGNHEAMLLEGQSDPASERVYQLEALRSSLTSRQLEMILSWPALRQEVFDGLKMLLVHGSPADPTYGYVYPDTDLAGFKPDADWVFMGNTHHPFIREHAGTYYVNIGSCGMPRDDGRYGSVALLDTKARNARILRFDITAESRQVLERFPMVHPSVRDVYERRRPAVMGDIL
jgi:predicted phosphodiesterase